MKKRFNLRSAFLLGQWILIVLFASTPLANAQNGSADHNPFGVWLSEKGTEKIEIYEANGKICGRIIWMAEEYDSEGNLRVDSKNEIDSLRTRPIVGIEILYGFKYLGKEVLKGGKIYDPGSGKTYVARIKLVDASTAKIRGYVITPLFGRTEVCTKILE